jgi:hypothetical protein
VADRGIHDAWGLEIGGEWGDIQLELLHREPGDLDRPP